MEVEWRCDEVVEYWLASHLIDWLEKTAIEFRREQSRCVFLHPDGRSGAPQRYWASSSRLEGRHTVLFLQDIPENPSRFPKQLTGLLGSLYMSKIFLFRPRSTPAKSGWTN